MKLDMLSYLGTDYAKDKQLIKKILSNPSILVGWVDSFNAENGTVNVQPAIQDKIIDENAVLNYVNKPYLINCWVIANTLNRQPQTGDKALILVLDEKSNNFFKSQYDSSKPLSLQTFVNTSKNVKSLSNCVAIIVNSDFIKDTGTIVNVGGVAQNEINFTSDPQTQIDNITGDISTLQDDVEELGNELNTTNSNLSTEIANRENADTNLQNQINDINNNSWTLFLHQPLSTVSGVSSVNITNVFDFHNYDYKIEYLWTPDEWAAVGVKLRFLNSLNNIITFTYNSWIRTTLNTDYDSGQQGSFTPGGYAKCGNNDTIADWGLDANDGKGPIVYNGEFIAGYDYTGARVINYNTLGSRASFWCQQQYQYSGTLDISDSLIEDGITGLNLFNDENVNLLANKSYIKLYRRKGGWNNNF